MNSSNYKKNWLFTLALICLCYSILVTFLSYFSLNYNLDFVKNSYLYNFYFSIDNSFAGYLIAGTWAFMDIFVLLTVFSIFYLFSEKIINSLDKNV